MRRVLITGAGGFAGNHLVAACLAQGWEVHGTRLTADGNEAPYPGMAWHMLDLRSGAAVAALVAHVQPEGIFHLAAQASVAAAWADPLATLTDNIAMAQCLLEATRRGAPEARLLVVGSSEEYGAIEPGDLPVVEGQPLRPVDPYGVSKAAVDLLGQQYHLAFGMHVVRMRPFNHIGPGQRRGFAVADFAAQVAAIERGEMPPVLRVGNLQARRDFTDVRDVVRAYILAIQHGTPGAVYNVCSGVAVGIGALVELLVAASRVPVQVEVDPARLRPVDRPEVVGSAAALQMATGWQPVIPLSRTLGETLAFWREAHRP